MKQRNDGTGKWYVSTYIKFPIHEPAEGGYYYSGAYVSSHYVFNTRKGALRFLRKNLEENREQAELVGQKFWQAYDGTEYGANGEYIGDGWYVRLERTVGEDEHGYVPYS